MNEELNIITKHRYTYFKSEKSAMKLENILNYHKDVNVKFDLGYEDEEPSSSKLSNNNSFDVEGSKKEIF